MFKQDLIDIDYEDMDDLPLSDHIEWKHNTADNDATQDTTQMYWFDD